MNQTAPPNARLSLEDLLSRTIEELLEHCDLTCLDFDEAKVWGFVQSALHLKPDALYKRKTHLYARLLALPGVPEILQKVVGLLWRCDMYHWAGDSEKTAERLAQQGQEDEARALHYVAVYLRWTFAQGHESYRFKSLDWVKTASLKELFKVYNPMLLILRYPTASYFQSFVHTQGWPVHQIMTTLATLRHTITQLNPCPRRLITLLDALVR